MAHHPIITGCLLGVAVTLCLLCAIGLAVMSDTFQRFHFASPITSMAIWLITIAVWVEDHDWQARIKSTLIAITLFVMNAIMGHATARAIRLREVGHWAITPDERLPLVKDHGLVGESNATQPSTMPPAAAGASTASPEMPR